MTEFILAAVIRQTLACTPEPDPHVVAELVFAEIPESEYGTVLAELLPDAVRQSIHRARSHSVPARNGKRDLGALMADPARKRVFVPGVGWKFEADCTADDCDAIADDYEKRASQNAALARVWRARAAELRKAAA